MASVFILSPVANAIAQQFGIQENVSYTPTVASPLTIDPNQGPLCKLVTNSTVGSFTVNAASAGVWGQILHVLVSQYSGGSATVTFGTNFRAVTTVTPSSAAAIIVKFISDGTGFIEVGRTGGSV